MIIHKEQLDIQRPDGTSGKKLVVSYINKDGNVDYMGYDIPKEQMFEWKYTTKAHADNPFYEVDKTTNQYKLDENGNKIVRQWKSYDDKFVRKNEVKELPEMRVNELLSSFGKSIDPLFEMNIPITWWCDIETEVTEEGFVTAEEASTRINTISMTRFPYTIIFSRKDLTLVEQEWVQKQIDEYSEKNNGSDISKGYKFIFKFYPTEREMLEAFLDFLICPQIEYENMTEADKELFRNGGYKTPAPIAAVSGWNFLPFDWLYIYNRCKMNNIDIERISPTRQFDTFKITPRAGGNTINVKIPKHRIIYDYLLVYKTWDTIINPKENNTLDFVAEKALGIKKVKHEWGFQEFFDEHFKEYVFYNCIDTILVEHIDQVIKTSEIWYMIACELRLELNVAFSTIQPTHVVMCNFEYPQYKVFPSEKKEIDAQADYEGAFVWPTRPGIFKYIGGLDFASLYPSIIRQFGISPETFLFKDKNYKPKPNEIKTKSGAVYRKDPNAMIPAILTHYYALRKKAKGDRKDVDTVLEELKEIYYERTHTS